MPVNKGRVGLLVAALESGEYEQGKMALHIKDSEGKDTWCCLGVGADVARRFGLDLTSEFEPLFGGDISARREIIGGNPSYMCAQVADWFGFDSENPALKTPEGETASAAEWNDGNVLTGNFDGDGKAESIPSTFADIAAGFRRTYLEAPDGE